MASFKRHGKEVGMERILDMRPPRIAIGLLILSLGLWHFSPQHTVLYFHYKLIGTVFVVLGPAFNIWGWVLFKKAGTAVCPTAENSVLVTTGIFAMTRNPMYLGMLMTLVGAAFLMGTMPTLFAPAAFFLIMDKVFIPYEEEKLLKKFGAVYSDYVLMTRRWL